jgi:hypothetical protein
MSMSRSIGTVALLILFAPLPAFAGDPIPASPQEAPRIATEDALPPSHANRPTFPYEAVVSAPTDVAPAPMPTPGPPVQGNRRQ